MSFQRFQHGFQQKMPLRMLKTFHIQHFCVEMFAGYAKAYFHTKENVRGQDSKAKESQRSK